MAMNGQSESRRVVPGFNWPWSPALYAALTIVLCATGCGAREREVTVSGEPGASRAGAPPAKETVAAPGALTAADEAALRDPCSLLSAAELRRLSGRDDYMDGISGDELGEGTGGGASCQWSGAAFGGPPERSPMISVVVIPPRDGQRWTERVRAMPQKDCSYAPAAGAAPGSFFEECAALRSLPLYVPLRAVDLIVMSEVRPPATADSVRPSLVAIADAVAAKLR